MNIRIFTSIILTTPLMTILLISCEPPTEAKTTGRIEGVIYDASNSQPLSGVTITTEPITSSKVTDTNGSFILEGVEPGNYTLQAARNGYYTNMTTVSVVADETASADMQLEPLSPELSVSTSLLNFGTSTNSLTFTITNTGVGTLSWNVISSANWFTVTPTSGTTETESDVVTITVDRTAMSYGNYYETITIASNTNSKSIDIVMTIPNPNAPQLSVYPVTLDFGNIETQMAFSLQNSGTGLLTWNVTDDKSWISVSPQSGTTETETDELSVTVDRIGMDPGTYNGSIIVNSDGGDQTLNVVLTISENPLIAVTPSSLDFGEHDTIMVFSITNAGAGILNWFVSDNQAWISMSPLSGTNYGTVSVEVSREGMASGDYTGTITASSNGGSADVTVLMNVPIDQPPEAVTLGNPTTITNSSMTLSWDVSSEEDFSAYRLYRDQSSNVSENSLLVAQINSRYTHEYTDTLLEDGITYYYQVYVVDAAGQSTGSNVVSATTIKEPGTWGAFATLGTNLRWISVLRDDFVYAVGDTGKIYKWNGSIWSQIESPTTNNLGGVAVVAENDIWIAGDDGVWHTTGTIWQQEAGYPSTNCSGIDFSSSNDIWVAAEDAIHHYNGSGWNTSTFNTGWITDIKAISASDVWAVSAEGQVLHNNGLGWSELDDLYTSWGSFCSGIWGSSIMSYWVGGQDIKTSQSNYYGYEIRHWNGSSWDGYSGWSIYDIDGTGDSNLWFCGSGGRLYHWNGVDLSEVNSPVDETIYMVTFSNQNSGWGVGAGGVVLRYSD